MKRLLEEAGFEFGKTSSVNDLLTSAMVRRPK